MHIFIVLFVLTQKEPKKSVLFKKLAKINFILLPKNNLFLTSSENSNRFFGFAHSVNSLTPIFKRTVKLIILIVIASEAKQSHRITTGLFHHDKSWFAMTKRFPNLHSAPNGFAFGFN